MTTTHPIPHTRHHVQASRESDLPAPGGRCIDRDPTPINQNPRSMYIIARRVVSHRSLSRSYTGWDPRTPTRSKEFMHGDPSPPPPSSTRSKEFMHGDPSPPPPREPVAARMSRGRLACAPCKMGRKQCRARTLQPDLAVGGAHRTQG
jgi:hypothetical protein